MYFAYVIGKNTEEILKEWGLKNVSTITVDNASSNDVVVAFFEEEIEDYGRISDRWSIFPC